MTDQRFIIEMGMGNDLHGMNYQKAALRAIEDAFRHSSIPMFNSLEISHNDMRVQVTVGVQDPAQLDLEALSEKLPRGNATVKAVKGGQNVAPYPGGDTIVIATAAIEAFLPNQSNNWKPSR